MNNSITKYNAYFPLSTEREIPRDSFIRTIYDMFKPDKPIMIIDGAESSGKTVLLSQFAKYYEGRCITYFIQDNQWSSTLMSFLLEMCIQMKELPALSAKFNKEITSDYSVEQLKQLFYRMHRELVTHIISTGTGPYFFVIDGLDKLIENHPDDNIIRYLPPTNTAGLYLLLSSNGIRSSFPKSQVIPMQSFSFGETLEYFGELLDKQRIKKIHDITNGMPGYLNEIYSKFEENNDEDNFNNLIENLPNTFNKFLERELEKIKIDDNLTTKMLSMIVFSPKPMNLSELSNISGFKKSEIESSIKTFSFISVLDDEIINVSSSYKSVLINKLQPTMLDSVQKLINFYESSQNEDAALFLPSLYQRADNYDSLVNLMKVENLTKILGTQRSSTVLRKNLRSLSEMAYQRKDNQRLFWSGLTESFFTQMISTPPAIEHQVNALLALDNFEQAINSAYACFLPEDRIMVLAKIGNAMKQKEMPVPNEILKTIEESVELIDNTVELTESLANKLLDICIDLITLQTNVALKLIEKIAESRGNSDHKNKLMDNLLTNVLIKVGPDDTTAERIKAQLNDDSLNDFARAASSVIQKIAVDEVYEQIAQIQDVSAKIYLLISWCNTNNKNENICEIVKFSLDLMNQNPEYSPTQLQLRQLAQSLLPNLATHDETKIKSIIDQFDIFKETIIKQPVDENARLELILAQIIKRWSIEEATSRFYNVYFSIDSISDIDIRCLVVVRLLLTHKKLAPDDEKLQREFLNELNIFFESLLTSSADHHAITKKLIAAVTLYDHELAKKYAGLLNTAGRRDHAYGEILRQYTIKKDIDHSIDFIYELLDKITSEPYREWVFTQTLKRFSVNQKQVEYSKKIKYLNRILNIKHTVGRTFALSYFITWIHQNDYNKSQQLFETLKDSFHKIDCLWEQVQVGFEITKILAEVDRDFATTLYYLSEMQKNNSVFADSRITDLYIETIKLLIRIVPDVITKKDYKERIYLLINAIEQIPSTLERSILLSNLSIKCFTYGKSDLFNEIGKIMLKELDQCKNEVLLQEILMQISPALYEVERNLLFDKISHLPKYMQDGALEEVLKYLFTKRLPIDSVDIDSFPTRLDYPEALKVVEIIEHLSRDSLIYAYIEKLSESITERKNNKYKSLFVERQVLGIVERLQKVIDSKLPDPDNIQHDGYKIACRAAMAKLKDSLKNSNAYRANSKWDLFDLNWESINKEIIGIPNLNDRVFLQATLAPEVHYSGNPLGENMVVSAEKNLAAITNSIDRADKFHLVAKAYSQLSNSKAAKFLLEESIRQSNAFSNHETRDQLLGNIIELAHSLDPNFASNIANNIDSPMFLSKSREKIQALNLRSDPSKIDISKKEQYLPIISSACSKVLDSLYSGRGVTIHESVISRWMYCCLGYDFETVSKLVLWYVENSIFTRNQSLHTSKLDTLYSETLTLLDMISNMSSIAKVTMATSTNSNFLDIIAPKMFTFNMGQKDFAMDFLKNWLRENTDEYVKFYDYYFTHSDIEILKHVPLNTNVQILASAKQSELDIKEIQERFKAEWKSICDQVPPETKVYFFATPSGRTPQHDRFIITDKAGLNLGTSLNGFGSRDTVINVLDFNGKTKIEKEIVDPLIINPPRFVGEERMICRTFSLEID